MHGIDVFDPFLDRDQGRDRAPSTVLRQPGGRARCPVLVGGMLPVGLLQTVASVKHGYWYSRSSEFLGQGFMQTLRWMRMPGDTLFAVGAIAFVLFVFGLGLGYSLAERRLPAAGAKAAGPG